MPSQPRSVRTSTTIADCVTCSSAGRLFLRTLQQTRQVLMSRNQQTVPPLFDSRRRRVWGCCWAHQWMQSTGQEAMAASMSSSVSAHCAKTRARPLRLLMRNELGATETQLVQPVQVPSSTKTARWSQPSDCGSLPAQTLIDCLRRGRTMPAAGSGNVNCGGEGRSRAGSFQMQAREQGGTCPAHPCR